MGTTTDKLEAALLSKEDIRSAIEQHGVECDRTVPFSEYGNKVRAIQRGTNIMGLEIPGVLLAVHRLENSTAGLKVLEQPKDAVGSVGQNVFFSVTAVGNDVKFQWQVLLDGADKWAASANEGNTSSVTRIVMSDKLHASKHRCFISDSTGAELVTDEVWLLKQEEV